MHRKRIQSMNCKNPFSLLSFLLVLSSNVFLSDQQRTSTESTRRKLNPFTAKASLIRYWRKCINSTNAAADPSTSFLLTKASPLTTVESTFYAKLAAQNALSSHLTAFCTAANLFCLHDSNNHILLKTLQTGDSFFSFYTNKQFENYSTSGVGGADQFKNYSGGVNFATGSFTRYSRRSTDHVEGFDSYANDGNVAASNFTSYGLSSTGGSADFRNYMPRVNVPDLRFTSYDSNSNGHELSFSSYADNTNAGDQDFSSYGTNDNSVPAKFTSYARTSNIVRSTFLRYGEVGNGANNSFTAYASGANNPSNAFKNYGEGGNGNVGSFSSYRDSANGGTDSFESYARESSSGKSSFLNYGKSINIGFDSFKEYGIKAFDPSTGFKIYGVNATFSEYSRKGVTFAQYVDPRPAQDHDPMIINGVEENKFFRERMLVEGMVMKLPDIQDWTPSRSFLPRSISSKIPFSSKDILELKRVFLVEGDDSTMESMFVRALGECERPPSRGETKRCVASIEGMIDFATSVLGRNAVVRTTKNVNGSNQNVMIGKVKGINRGEVTESVSCHQTLYPYLLYYCHSVPKVRLYEAEILDVETKAMINNGVAVCHLDTSAWGRDHVAFIALGSSPGLIEVCHWIFENDFSWARAD